MPRRGRSGGMMRAPPAPARPAPPPARAAPPPAPMPQSAPAPMAAQPRQPGMFAQMASTAAGVAVGSAVGHTIGAAMTGGMGGHSQEVAPAPAAAAPPAPIQNNYDPNNNPCRYQLQQFLECAQKYDDISLCMGFNEALKECKLMNGLQ